MINTYIATKLDFVNTSESYSKTIFLGNGNLLIPYINVGLMPGNPINSKQSVVDYSYYLLRNVQTANLTGNTCRFNLEFATKVGPAHVVEYVSVGGISSESGVEIKVVCMALEYLMPAFSTINNPEHPFIPVNTPRYKANMDVDKVSSFFSLENLPTEIVEILGDNICAIKLY